MVPKSSQEGVVMKYIQFINSIDEGLRKGLIRKEPSWNGDEVWIKATGSFFMNNKDGLCLSYNHGDIVDLIINKDRK